MFFLANFLFKYFSNDKLRSEVGDFDKFYFLQISQIRQQLFNFFKLKFLMITPNFQKKNNFIYILRNLFFLIHIHKEAIHAGLGSIAKTYKILQNSSNISEENLVTIFCKRTVPFVIQVCQFTKSTDCIMSPRPA